MRDREMERFDEALKAWAERPLETPPDEAVQELLAHLPEKQTGAWLADWRWRLATATTGLALLVMVGWATLFEDPGPSTIGEEVALPPLHEDVVLLWLDEETPLYLTVAPPATEGGSR